MPQCHQPVLLTEVLSKLRVRPDGVYVDATFGRGGHAGAILARLGKDGRLLTLDQDRQAVAHAQKLFGEDRRVSIAQAPFSTLGKLVRRAGWAGMVDGILMDVGVSSPQLDDPERGFSFNADGPLDMRMNPERGESAASWLARADEKEMAEVIKRYGEERHSRRIARAIVAQRRDKPIRRTKQLADLVAAAVPSRQMRKHPATRTFQAIRILVNHELDELAHGLAACIPAMRIDGRMCVISFHSLEDRLVKRFIRDHARPDPVYAGLPEIPVQARPSLEPLGRAMRPTASEIQRNPRARSAVLRVARRVAQ